MQLKDCLKDPVKRDQIRSLLHMNSWWNLKILFMYVLWLGVAYWTITTRMFSIPSAFTISNRILALSG